jgi:hypothetical protein
MFASRYFCDRMWAPRYWAKTGSDVAHVIAAIIFAAPVRRILIAPLRAVIEAPFRRWR